MALLGVLGATGACMSQQFHLCALTEVSLYSLLHSCNRETCLPSPLNDLLLPVVLCRVLQRDAGFQDSHRVAE